MPIKKPNFIIIGAQKAGTSSLFYYLKNHKQTLIKAKEPHFFDLNYEKGFEWYSLFFQFNDLPLYKKLFDFSKYVKGESSPYYLYHPWVPGRIHEFDPKIKFIVLLRDPVDRAISHYFHEVKKDRESLPLYEALLKEEERLAEDREWFFQNPDYYSYNHQRFSYKDRGKYSEQLKRWFFYFPRDQFLIINSNDFFTRTREVMNYVCDFLSLKYYREDHFQIKNPGKKDNVDSNPSTT